jgi:hypothetical protein
MLNTSGISTEAKVSKTILPGNVVAKINDITIETPSYDADCRHIILHLEGVKQGGDFEGFLRNKDNASLGRFEGQIGRVKLSYFPFKDFTNKTGTYFNRDQTILKVFAILGKALGKTEELNKVNANTIEQYIPAAAAALRGDTFIRWCIGGKEYQNKQGFLNYDLFVVKSNNGKYPFESMTTSPSKIVEFKDVDHIVKEKTAGAVASFGPSPDDLTPDGMGTNNYAAPEAAAAGKSDDFDLPF